MTYRAIGKALGVSEYTAHKDAQGVSDLTPDRTTGTDGKSYPARQKPVVVQDDIDDSKAAHKSQRLFNRAVQELQVVTDVARDPADL